MTYVARRAGTSQNAGLMDQMPYDYAPANLPEPVALHATGEGFAQRCMLVAADAVGGLLKAGDPKALKGRFLLVSGTDAMGHVEFVGEAQSLSDGMVVFRWLLVSATGRRGNLVAVLRGILGLKAQLKGKHDAIPQGRVLVFDALQQSVRMLHLPDPDSGELTPVQRLLAGEPLDPVAPTPAPVDPPADPAPQAPPPNALGSPPAGHAAVTHVQPRPQPQAPIQPQAQAPRQTQGYAIGGSELPAYQPESPPSGGLPAFDGYGSPSKPPSEPLMPSWDEIPGGAAQHDAAPAPQAPALQQPAPQQPQQPHEPSADPDPRGGDSGPLTAAYEDYQRTRRRNDRTILSAPPALEPDGQGKWRPAQRVPASAHLEDLAPAGSSGQGSYAGDPASKDVFPPQSAPIQPRLAHASDRLTLAGEQTDYRAPTPTTAPNQHPDDSGSDARPDSEGHANPSGAGTTDDPPSKRRTGRHVIGLEDVVTDEAEFEQVGFLIPPPTRKRTTGTSVALPPAAPPTDEGLSSRLAARAKRASSWRTRAGSEIDDGPLLGRRPRPRNTDTNPVAKTEVPFGAGTRPAAQTEQTDPQLDGPVFQTEPLLASFKVNGKEFACEWEFVGHTRAGFATGDLGCTCQVGDIADVSLPAEPISDRPIEIRAPIRHVTMRTDGKRVIHLHLKAPNAYVPRDYRRIVQFWSLKGRRQ